MKEGHVVSWFGKAPGKGAVTITGKGGSYNMSTGVIKHPRRGKGKVKVKGAGFFSGLRKDKK